MSALARIPFNQDGIPVVEFVRKKNTIGEGVSLYLPPTHERLSVSWASELLYDAGILSVKLILKGLRETATDWYVAFPGLRVCWSIGSGAT